jgi:hypothetical protein
MRLSRLRKGNIKYKRLRRVEVSLLADFLSLPTGRAAWLRVYCPGQPGGRKGPNGDAISWRNHHHMNATRGQRSRTCVISWTWSTLTYPTRILMYKLHYFGWTVSFFFIIIIIIEMEGGIHGISVKKGKLNVLSYRIKKLIN